MTHFIVLVIVPKEVYTQGQAAVESYIENVLAKYSEHLEVEPYISKTKDEVEATYEQQKGRYTTLEEFREDWYGKAQFDNDGNLLTTYNPDSLFDWWEIGGRWDGLLFGESDTKKVETLDYNSLPVSKLLEKFKQYLSMEM